MCQVLFHIPKLLFFSPLYCDFQRESVQSHKATVSEILSVLLLSIGDLALDIVCGEDSQLNCLSFMFETFIVSAPMNYLLQIYLRNFISLPSLVCMYIQLVSPIFHVV